MKRKYAVVIVTGLLLGAGAAQAKDSAFPSAANEFPLSTYMERTQDAGTRTGAMQPVYPSAAIEHGPAREVSIEPRREGTTPSVGRTAFPSAANEVL